MGLLVNTYIFYGDIYFVQNFLVKLTLLFLISYSLKIQTKVSIIKIVLIAGFGTIFEVLGLLSGISYEFFLTLVHLFEVPCMVLVLIGKFRTFLVRGIVLGYLYTIFVNGVLEVFSNSFGKAGHYMLLLTFACIVCVFGVITYQQIRKQNKDIYMVELVHGDRKLSVKAFYDSGNHLKDLYTKKGVHIISEKLLKELSLIEEKKVYIPYQSLGNSNGLIEVYYMDSLHIYGQKNMIEQHKIPVGVAKEDLFLNKSYEMILNEEVF